MKKLFLAVLLTTLAATAALAQAKAAPTPKAQAGATEEVAVLETKYGNIVIRFFPDKAPNHVKNFKELCSTGFYDGTRFHRVVPGFMIQGGDPNTKSGDPSTWGMGNNGGKTLKAEFNDVHHRPGIVSMARSNNPDSASCQFFICVGEPGFLDGKYTVFGEVIEGMDAVNQIANAPREPKGPGNQEGSKPVTPVTITKAKVEKRAAKAPAATAAPKAPAKEAAKAPKAN